jgi:hypothetical protein
MTSMVAVLLITPGALAVMVVEPKGTPVRLKVPVVLSGRILTLAGLKLTCPGAEGLPERAMVVPPAGAGALSVSVPPTLCVIPTAVALLLNAIEMGHIHHGYSRLPVSFLDDHLALRHDDTYTTAAADVNPGAEAVTVVLPIPTGVTVKLTSLEFGGTMTRS